LLIILRREWDFDESEAAIGGDKRRHGRATHAIFNNARALAAADIDSRPAATTQQQCDKPRNPLAPRKEL
jgi:hypothetical protein